MNVQLVLEYFISVPIVLKNRMQIARNLRSGCDHYIRFDVLRLWTVFVSPKLRETHRKAVVTKTQRIMAATVTES